MLLSLAAIVAVVGTAKADEETPIQVAYGESMYFADGVGNVTKLVFNSADSLTITQADAASPTGWTATTLSVNAAPVEASVAQPNPPNPVPAYGAVIGGVVIVPPITRPIKIGDGPWSVAWITNPDGSWQIVFRLSNGVTFTQYWNGAWIFDQPGKPPIGKFPNE